MHPHKVVSRHKRLAARQALLAKERALTQHREGHAGKWTAAFDKLAAYAADIPKERTR